MNKKKSKQLLILVIIILGIIFAYNLFKVFTTNKQTLEIVTSKQISTSGTIEAIVGVKDKKTEKSIKSKITVELRNNNNRKVKNFKETFKIEEGERANISIPLPENIEPGNYNLKISSQAGLKTDTEKIKISVTDKNAVNTVISLDKGIYKPGDTVNFRALLISKQGDEPKEEDVEISIFDANENRVYINKTKTSEFGIVSGTFTLASEVNSGEYKISVSTKSTKASKTFKVNPYVVPTFEVSTETTQDTYHLGDKAHITINAKYFFGEPVTNATIKGTINDEEFTGLTNENGTFEFEKYIVNAGKYDLKAEIVDTSNYLIETSKTFYATNNLFEVEIIPENGNIIKGIENKIYVITKRIDGTPIKTHIEANLGKINRQIVTDNDGIGILTLNANDINELDDITRIKMTATDMNNESVTSYYDASLETYTGTVVTLDKLKYKQNEDITLNLNNTTDTATKDVLIYKNNELLKVISTDSNRVTVNLEDTYGLIDIYAKNNIRRNYSWDLNFSSSTNYSDNYSKKTIFISPEKALKITISEDKEEYRPGEKLNLTLKTENEKGDAVDSAVLVSILDEAVLSLADNDLSIDNIKLALEDIELSEGITLADLYAEVLNTTSESKLRIALLKQTTNTPNIAKIVSKSYSDEHTKYIIKSIVFAVILTIFVFISVSNKYPKLKIGLIAIFNLLYIFLIILICLYEFLYYNMDFSQTTTLVITSIISIILYTLILYKLNTWIFNALINLILLPGILLLGVVCALDLIYSQTLALTIAFVPAIIMTILIVISRKFVLNKFFNIIKNLMIQTTISEIIYILTMIVISMLDIYVPLLAIAIVLVLYLLSQKIYRFKSEKIIIETTSSFVIVFIIGVVFILGAGLLYIYNSSTNSIYPATSGITNEMLDVDSSLQTSKSDSAFFEFNTFSSNVNNVEGTTVEEEIVSTETNNVTDKIEENVRNVFLESLAFIPEVITTNGTANTSIDMSDNITTWNIQAVGNTKDGRIGYNSSTFKVFKEFFIDFSLPTNSVVTDKTNIPVTIYNYTENEMTISLNVIADGWATLGSYDNSVTVLGNSTKMVYIPVELLKAGNQTFRVEGKANNVSDIVEKTLTINTNGIKKSKVVSSGSTDKKIELDHFTTDTAIENTRKLKLKLYPSVISQVIEGMENIFKMPTGCFEQTSSALYPNILALKYLENTGLTAPDIKKKALEYISEGYQRILTFETSEKGGYSLYGNDPAETVLTAFGLMELNDLKSVYDIDEQVIENMTEYLFSEQNFDGTFYIGSTYIGSPSSTDNLAMNSYIIWALSEVCPEDSRLKNSIKYLEDNYANTDDNYTLALVANIFSNTKNKELKTVINKLMEAVVEDESGGAYIPSMIRDYWGTYGRYQNIQTTSLTSMALTKENNNISTNKALLQYIIANKDTNGTWSTTQSTILALKAINLVNSNQNISNQTITATINGEYKDIEIKDNPLDLYELSFDNILNENKISLDFKKGNIYYEIVEEYYQDYETLDNQEDSKITVTQTMDTTVKVNDIIHQNITVTNTTGDDIKNALVQISIPQGCSVNEEALIKMETVGIIAKYEYNYNTINLYIRDFAKDFSTNLAVEYRANYPEQITGGLVRAYDYYNPSNEGFAKPVNILVNN